MDGIRFYDNYEDDGQLSLFCYDDSELAFSESPAEEERMEDESLKRQPETELSAKKQAVKEQPAKVRQTEEKTISGASELQAAAGGFGIRIRRCGSCGKQMFIREETGGYAASCNNCGIEYFQKV